MGSTKTAISESPTIRPEPTLADASALVETCLINLWKLTGTGSYNSWPAVVTTLTTPPWECRLAQPRGLA
jgi:hypothetical protein